jgi:hypothetical protein
LTARAEDAVSCPRAEADELTVVNPAMLNSVGVNVSVGQKAVDGGIFEIILPPGPPGTTTIRPVGKFGSFLNLIIVIASISICLLLERWLSQPPILVIVKVMPDAVMV